MSRLPQLLTQTLQMVAYFLAGMVLTVAIIFAIIAVAIHFAT